MADKHNHLLELVMFDIAYVISNCDYEYSSDELFELGSLHAFTIIIFLSIAIYFFDSFLEKKIVLKDKK